MAAIVHALYIIGQLIAIMGVVFALPLVVCECCRYWWKCRCARREECLGTAAGLTGSTSSPKGCSRSASIASEVSP